METDLENYENIPPIMVEKTTVELTDYHCPFCNFQLFRRHVPDFNMDCSQGPKLAKRAMISLAEKDLES